MLVALGWTGFFHVLTYHSKEKCHPCRILRLYITSTLAFLNIFLCIYYHIYYHIFLDIPLATCSLKLQGGSQGLFSEVLVLHLISHAAWFLV